jgi:hypothetical protein
MYVAIMVGLCHRRRQFVRQIIVYGIHHLRAV